MTNDGIQNKQIILQELQIAESTEELIKLMEDNEITVDLEKEIIIPIETIKEHNMEYSSYGMEWDNTEILEYINNHKEELRMPILTSFKDMIKKVKGLFHRNGIKALPERLEQGKKDKNSWDLSNWEISVEGYRKDSEEIIRGYLNNSNNAFLDKNKEEEEI